MTNPEPTVYIIDDDAEIRKSIALLFSTVGLKSRGFSSAVDFLASIKDLSLDHCCLIADVRMPGMTGIELMAALKQMQIAAPIIFITGHGDIGMAVKAVKDGAEDFLTKPFNEEVLLETVNSALRSRDTHLIAERTIAECAERYNTLTAREKQVMQQVVDGKANKVVAAELSITQRTVELHRANAMRKMQAKTLSDLVRMSIVLSGAASD